MDRFQIDEFLFYLDTMELDRLDCRNDFYDNENDNVYIRDTQVETKNCDTTVYKLRIRFVSDRSRQETDDLYIRCDENSKPNRKKKNNELTIFDETSTFFPLFFTFDALIRLGNVEEEPLAGFPLPLS